MDNEIHIYNSLKKWRLNKSKIENCPAYIICHNTVIEDLSKYIVKDKDDLYKIKGVGDKFIKSYSEEIFEILLKEYKKLLN